MSNFVSRRGKRLCAAALAICTAGAVLAHASATPAHRAFSKENDAAMALMMKNMHVHSSGDVDRDFIAMMIPHHQGAIDMARAQLRHGQSNELKRLSRQIIAKQQEEIAHMRRMQAALGGAASSNKAVPAAAGAKGGTDHAH